MLRWAVKDCKGPVAIRYPRGGDRGYAGADWQGEENTVACHRKGADVTIVTYGTLLQNAMDAAELLSANGVEATVLRLMSVSDLPVKEVCEKMAHNCPVFVMEEVCGGSGIREALALGLQHVCSVSGVDLGHNFVPHGTVDQLYKQCGLDARSVCDSILEVLRSEN